MEPASLDRLSRSTFARLGLLALATLAFSSAASATTTATRPWPFPSYSVGQNAQLNITTQPAQPNQPVYRFRYKNNSPDGAQPTYIGTTDANGNLSNLYTLQATDVGHYTGERFAVGSASAPTTPALSYHVHAALPPIASRAAPFPNYQVGDTARLEVQTSPAQPHQAVYRYRLKDGLDDGDQPTVIGWTDSTGRLIVEVTITGNEVGAYSGEQYAVGTPDGPRSPSNTYWVMPSVAPSATRPSPYPNYRVGDLATLELSTNPAQPNQKVYRTRRKDGVWSHDLLIGWTNSAGSLTRTYTLTAEDVGQYQDESFVVGVPGGLASAPLAYTVTSSGPIIQSTSTQLVEQGTLRNITLYGENLGGTHLSIEGSGSTLPSVSLVSSAADRLVVQIDARSPGIQGYFTLKVENDAGSDRAAFEVAPAGPTVTGHSPPYPEQGQTYALIILGHRLGDDVTVESTSPDAVRVLLPNSGGGALVTNLETPPGATVSGDGAIQGLLQVAADAPAGPVQLIIRDSQGGATSVTVHVQEAGRAAKGYSEHSLKDLATAAIGSGASGLPDINVQDFVLDQNVGYNKSGPVGGPVGDCLGEAHFRDFRQRAALYSLGETGEALNLVSLLLGQSRRFDVLSFSAYIDSQASWYWNCEPPSDESEFHWQIALGFDLVGVYSVEFTIRPWDGRIVFARETQSDFDYFNFDAPSNGCIELQPIVDFPDVKTVNVEQTRCCPDGVPVSFSAPVHQTSVVASATLVADRAIVLDVEPDEQDCPCWVAPESSTKTLDPPSCPASDLFLREISFLGDHDIYKDQLGGAPVIQDPVWKDANFDLNPEKNEPVAYTAGELMEINAVFDLQPEAPVWPQQTVHVKGEASNGLIFESRNVPLSGTTLTLSIEADAALPQQTDHLKPLIIEWTFSADGTVWYPAGESRHEVFVTLNNPVTLISNLFLSVLELGIGGGGATTEMEAAQRTWEMFSFGGNAPVNISTWEGRPLHYYPQGVGFSGCATDAESLLTQTAGAGQCGSFAHLLMEALAVNGVGSTFTTVAANDGHQFLVPNFSTPTIPTVSVGEYKWRLDLVLEAGGFYGMVPAPPNGRFGDLTTVAGVAGQNSPTPSEKAFARHFIVHVPSLGLYLDPSYGKQYVNSIDFKNQSVFGFHRSFAVLPSGSYWVKPGSSFSTSITFTH